MAQSDIEIRYINKNYNKDSGSGISFLVLVSLGFICAVGAMCVCLWVFR